MTNEEWVKTLKPGDEVAVMNYDFVKIGVVERVTPSGIVRTKKHGSYKKSRYSDHIASYGDRSFSSIKPLTPELRERAEENMRKIAQEQLVKSTISKAYNIAYDIVYRRISLSYDMAKKVIELLGEKV